jgi:NADH-quinone oxidoreductase subunit C
VCLLFLFISKIHFLISLSKLLSVLFLEKFVIFFFCTLLASFIKGFLVKPGKIFLFFYIFFIHSFLIFIKLNGVIKTASLMDIFGVDYPSRIGNFRFELTYSFWSHCNSFRIFLKTFVSTFLIIPSALLFFASSVWLEREVWDFLGLRFLLNIDLRRILTDYGFLGFPMRKDFPLTGYLETRYDDNTQTLVYESVELSQKFRVYNFLNSWA